MRKTIIFHGKCHGCTRQQEEKEGIDFCVGCRYFHEGWHLPDLNNNRLRDMDIELIRNEIIERCSRKLKFLHPGNVLTKKYLEPLGISNIYNLEYHLGIKDNGIIQQIIKGNRDISMDIAIRLSRFFDTSVEFWIGLQNDYDKEKMEKKHIAEYNKIQTYHPYPS